ncbi:helix-turn-helix domain-containing protein [Nonomuraea phyllanthi]|uniref:helix-turn-helix domain-containing protein n=1 Tax=Nonomuraea phyllanthi TaxID=2219224 RepID=UPI00186B0E1C|nr:helix-turn-helix transcriptional regulator [Nonomuraea phyllanthi]
MNATLRLRKDELAKHRVRAGLKTEGDLAAAMGADRGTVNRVMRGRAKPSQDFIASLMAALNDDVAFGDIWEVIPADSGESHR